MRSTQWRHVFVAVVVGSSVALAHPGRAQTPPPAAAPQLPAYRFRILGVFDEASGEPVEGVEVIDVTSGTKATTTATGTVSLFFLPDGGSLVRVRKLGYEPQTFLVAIAATQTTPVTVLLKPATTLPTVVVKDSVKLPSRLAAFEEHRKAGFGQFLTDSIFRRNENSNMANVLIGHMTGLQSVQTATGAVLLVSTRTPCKGGALSSCRAPNCFLTVYIDNVQVFNSSMSIAGALDVGRLSPIDYAAAEFYAGGAILPAGISPDEFAVRDPPPVHAGPIAAPGHNPVARAPGGGRQVARGFAARSHRPFATDHETKRTHPPRPVLGALITTVFTAANVYLGLKVGLTFASSIPAAVISMALLSAVKDSSILENNIVQTVASAAGHAVRDHLRPAGTRDRRLVDGFPFWQSFLICVSGGVLGVLFTIPLRRALVTTSDLPYPEGVAAAEVLKVGSGTRGETKDDTGEAREGLVAVILGSVASAGLAIITATRIAAAEVTGFFRLGATASSGYNFAWSLALFGAGHLVGLSVGMAMLVGLVIAWVVAVPILTSMQPAAAGVALAAHTIDDLAHAGALHRRRHDRHRGHLHAREARQAGGRRTGQHARASQAHVAIGGRQRSRPSPPWIIALTIACLVIAGCARVHVRAGRRSSAPSAVTAHADRRPVRADRRLSDRRHLRLHGGTDRRVEQPDLRRRHSVDRAVRVGSSLRGPADRRKRALRSSRSRCS